MPGASATDSSSVTIPGFYETTPMMANGSTRITGNEPAEAADPGGARPTKPGNPDKSGPPDPRRVTDGQRIVSGDRNTGRERANDPKS
jgi:hypothetical protein